MKIQYSLLGSLTAFAVTLLVLGTRAYADNTSLFNNQIHILQTHRAQVESQLGINNPHASLFYDGFMGHYEQEQQVRQDVFNKEIPFKVRIKALHIDRAQMESRLGLDPQADTYYPHATSYYDDLEDHYEHAQLMRDVIDEGIR